MKYPWKGLGYTFGFFISLFMILIFVSHFSYNPSIMIFSEWKEAEHLYNLIVIDEFEYLLTNT